MAVSLGILAFIGAKLDWAAFLRELQRVNVWHLPGLVVLLLAMFGMRAMRWRSLLPTPAPVSDLFQATAVGFFASFILPLRAGEIVRPLALSRWQPIPFTTALASIVTERLWDAITLLAMLGFTLPRMAEVPPLVQAGGRAIGAIAVILVGGLLFCYLFPRTLDRMLEAIPARLFRKRPALAERITATARHFLDGLRAVRSPMQALRVAFWSVTLWLAMALWYQMALWSFGEHPPWLTGMLLNLMVALAVAAPSAPGFIGTYQAGCLIALAGLSGFTDEFAIAFSIVTHMLQTVVVLATGALVLQRKGLRLSQLRGR